MKKKKVPLYESEPGLRWPDDPEVSGDMRALHALALVGDTVGLLLLELFLKLLPCLLCLRSELTGRVARIGPCFVVEHDGDDFRIR